MKDIENKKDIIVCQEKHNKVINVYNGLKIQQYTQINYDYIDGLSVYIKPIYNYASNIKMVISNGESSRSLSLPNYKVKYGWNYFSFESLKNTGNNDLIFSLSSDSDYYDLEYYENKNILDVLQFNKTPKKASLKYRLYGKIKKNS